MYHKNITPAFETIGKRRKLTGYLAELYDGQMLIHSQEYSTAGQAEQALDALVYELLTDLAEQGLVDDVPAALVAEGVTSTQIPSWLADVQAKTATCSEAHPCDNVNHNHTGYRTITTDSPDYRLHVNRVIVRTQVALGVPCKLCGGDHLLQHCPSIRALLFAEPVVMVMDLDFAPVGW